MEKEILLAELMKNCNGKKEKLMELMETLELAELGREVQNQQEKDIYNRVLSENEFFANDNFARAGVNVGDRITDESFMFMLSDKDFSKVSKLAHPLFVEQKICDEKGYYITNWSSIVVKAKNELVKFLIDEVVPKSFKELFMSNINSVVFQDKLINAFKNSIKPTA